MQRQREQATGGSVEAFAPRVDHSAEAYGSKERWQTGYLEVAQDPAQSTVGKLFAQPGRNRIQR